MYDDYGFHRDAGFVTSFRTRESSVLPPFYSLPLSWFEALNSVDLVVYGVWRPALQWRLTTPHTHILPVH